MQDTARVNVLETTQDLVNEKLDMLVTKALVGLDYLAQVRFHQFGHDVNLVEVFNTLWLENSFN